MQLIKTVCATTMMVAASLSSQAFAATVYTDQASFSAAAAGTPLTNVNFEQEDVAGSRRFSGVQVSSNGPLYYDGYANTSLGVGTGTPSTLTLTFQTAINFFGITLLDFGTAGSQDVFATTSNGQTQLLNDYTGVSSNRVFRGIYDSAGFSSLTFNGFTAVNDQYNVDDLQFGTQAVNAAVPEPATWAMMLVGFGGIGFAMRRRKSKVTTNVAYA